MRGLIKISKACFNILLDLKPCEEDRQVISQKILAIHVKSVGRLCVYFYVSNTKAKASGSKPTFCRVILIFILF